MKNKTLILIICFGVILFAGFLLFKKVRHNHGQQQQAGVYYCPMHPQITSDKPGTCPICYMTLVPKEENINHSPEAVERAHVEGHAPIQLSLQKQQLIGVKTAGVKRQVLTKTIRAVGTVAHDPELYQVQAEYIQAIERLKQVKEGGSSEVVLEQLERLVEASRTRLRHMGISEELIVEMASWTEPQHNLLFAHPGENIWIYAQIYEYEMPYVHVGNKVEVDVPNFTEEIFQGEVRAIDRMVDPMTRTVRVRVQLQDLNAKLKPNMYVNVKIIIDLGEVLTVPQEAVFDTGKQKIVFVVLENGLFEPRDVALGAKTDDLYEVKSGLNENDIVVTSGNFLMDSESRLKDVLQDMTEESQGGQHVH